MDEVTDPSLSVLAEGSFLSGPKSHIFNKIEDTSVLTLTIAGLKNNLMKKIPSKHMFHTRVRAASRIGPHNLDVISVIVGSLLGDCYASKRSVEGTRLCYRQSTVHRDYLFWLYKFFFTRGYCSNLEPRMYKRVLKNKGSDDKTHYGYEFNTFTFRSFNWVHKMFYKKGIKYISADLVKYITPLALAIWTMSQPKGYEELQLNTCFRSKEDIDKLILILKNRYDLISYSFKDNKNYFGVSIANESKDSFRSIIQPYLNKTVKSSSAQFKPLINLSLNPHFQLSILVKGNRYYSTKGVNSIVASYSNPINLKSAIYKENLKKSGIYRWTNLISGKTYIGSSSNLAKRFSGYFSTIFLTRESLKTKSLIYSALLKYGHSNFKLDILEYCDPKELLVREQYYLNLYSPEYNILKTAGSNLGFKHSDETLLKFKLREFSKEHLELIRKTGSVNFIKFNENKRLKVAIHDFSIDITTTYGSMDEASKVINVDTKTFWTKERSEKESKDIIPYKGKYVITILREGITEKDHLERVELARVNLSKGLINWNKAKGKIVVVTNVVTKETVNYYSVSDAARSLNVNRFAISRRIKDKKLLDGIYKFSYLD